jgi:hypothetical protein
MDSPPAGPENRSDEFQRSRTSAENRIAALARRPPPADEGVPASVYLHVSDYLHAMYQVVPAYRLYPLVVAAMRMSRGEPDVAPEDRTGRPVDLAAGLAMLAARIAYFDLDMRALADAHHLEAIGFAYQAHDMPAVAAATVHRALIESHAGGHIRARLLIGEANAILNRWGTGRLTQVQRLWQDVATAEVAVLGGDGVRGMFAMRTIGTRINRVQRITAPLWLDFFDRSWLAGTIGTAELHVGQPARAALMLRTCLRTAAPDAVKGRSVALADLADARRLQLDYAEACQLLSQALDVVDGHSYLIGLRRIGEVRRALPATVETASTAPLDRRLSTWDDLLAGHG